MAQFSSNSLNFPVTLGGGYATQEDSLLVNNYTGNKAK